MDGTTIVSDMWAGYNGIGNMLNGAHVTVNHSRYFVHPRHPNIHTNTIERLWKSIKQATKSFQESVVESHVLTAGFKLQHFHEHFDPLNPKRRRKVLSPGQKLEIMLETIVMAFPGLNSNGINFPPKVLVSKAAHPFDNMSSMIVCYDGQLGSQHVPALANTLASSPGQEAAALTTNQQMTTANNAINLATSQTVQNITSEPWATLELAAEKILEILCNTQGAYDTKQNLTAALRPFDIFIRTTTMMLRNAGTHIFNTRCHGGGIDIAVESTLAAGFLQGVRVLSTLGGGDCFFSSVSWNTIGSRDCAAIIRLTALTIILKYFDDFDTACMRVEIAIHHGPDGAMSLIRAAGGLAKRTLHTVIGNQYPSLVANFNYSSCATILACSIALKSKMAIYEDVAQANTGPMMTLAQLDLDFRMESSRPVSLRKYRNCLLIIGSQGYAKHLRVHLKHSHFTAFIPCSRLTPAMLLPQRMVTLQFNLDATDL
ncbi:uncharacterized protein LOC135947809 isoform X2 [Cloeon dipterum]